jgi:hypothetical protein
VKKILFITVLSAITFSSFAQEPAKSKREIKAEKKEERKQKINALIKQEEEGVLAYSKQNIYGLQFRTNGYGLFYEKGVMKSTRVTNLYHIGFDETKSPKEEKFPTEGIFFGNPYVYGKINNFYQLKLGFGQQYILGNKGNKNGVAVAAVYHGGLSLGLLRPYYIEVAEANGSSKFIKYEDDKTKFLSDSIIASGGLSRGWGEIKMKPGAYIKTGLRFDYGRYNEMVSAIETGIVVEYYASKIPILARQKDKNFFIQGYVSVALGRRK